MEKRGLFYAMNNLANESGGQVRLIQLAVALTEKSLGKNFNAGLLFQGNWPTKLRLPRI